MKGSAHCANMNPEEPSDPIDLKNGRKVRMYFRASWYHMRHWKTFMDFVIILSFFKIHDRDIRQLELGAWEI